VAIYLKEFEEVIVLLASKNLMFSKTNDSDYLQKIFETNGKLD
jgi:hypothetical protein